MTLPGGALLALDPAWDEARINRFFSDNNMSGAVSPTRIRRQRLPRGDRSGTSVASACERPCGAGGGADLEPQLAAGVRASVRLRLLIAACVAGSLLLFPASGVAQTVPEAPQAVTVVSGNTSLTVSWTAPGSAGGSAITAYDLRYILSDASDKADDQWTVVDPPWSSGTLQYEITTLSRDTSYDLEVRAVNASGDGPWSDTSTQATSDHADSRGGAERIALGASVPGRIDPADEDWFSITLSEPTGVYIYSTSQSDLSGALVRADGSSIAMSYNSGRPGNTLDFSLPASLGAGTYYLAVTAGATPGRSTGAYVVHFTTANAPGTPSTARFRLHRMFQSRRTSPLSISSTSSHSS